MPKERSAQRFDIPTRTLTHRALTRETLDTPLAGIPRPDTIAIASVVPWASDELIVVLQEIFPSATILVITSGNIPLRIDYPHPEELGTDRLLGALAAWKLRGEPEQRPCIVIDLGTATTYNADHFGWRLFRRSYCAGSGTWRGSARATGSAASYDRAFIPGQHYWPNNDRKHAIRNSLWRTFAAGRICRTIRRFAFPNEEPIVFATGGLSRLIEGRTAIVSHFDPIWCSPEFGLLRNSRLLSW